MDKAAIKTFAVESRRKLMEDVEYRMSLLGITKDKIAEPITKADGVEAYDYGASTPHQIYDEDIKKRENLVKEVQNKGFENVVEEVAYTWFNRIIAIRFMEVNDYLPTKTRVLSSETPGKTEPDIITEAFNIDLDYTREDRELIFKLKDENKLEELFRFLFIKQCNKLNDILPNLFEKTEDYMELLLSISFSSSEGFLKQLINTIPEEDYENVEIIGWLYQFYNSERKDKVNNALKSKPIPKEDIPAATQLFTPEWIVRYMVDNSLGRYWLERNPNSNLKDNLDYYFEEAPQIEEVSIICNELRSNSIVPENLKFFDPCMGSAHILVYAFDVYMKIYKELGYSEREIPELIIKNNLYGLDIDNRAYQLAYFTLLMKGRKFDRKLLNKNISPNICAFKNSEISEKTLNYISDFDFTLASNITYLKNIFANATEFGSLIQVKNLDFEQIETKLNELLNLKEQTILDLTISYEIRNNIFNLINQAKLLSNKYECVVTNPPYMNKYDKSMKDFVKKYYKDYSKDLFSIFIYRNFDFCTKDGFSAFMTPMVWMFIKNFEKLRQYIIENKTFVSLIEMEYMALWEIDAHVPACTFVLSNYNYQKKYNSLFLKLSEFTGGLEVQNKRTLDAVKEDVNYKFISNSDNFNQIPGCPMAYWADKHVFESFQNGDSLEKSAYIKVGLQTGDNNRFLRYWYEVNYENIGFNFDSCDRSRNSNLKWFPYNKGGKYKKWYGNQDYVINWQNDGLEIKNFNKSVIRNSNFYFIPAISWSNVTSSNVGFRYYPEGFIFDTTGCSLFIKDLNFYYLFAFLNSNVCQYILYMIAPTLHYNVGDIGSLPYIAIDENSNKIKIYVRENIEICKNDWDDYETSWNFKTHPFIRFKESTIEKSFNKWLEHKESDFNKLKSNEIELNKIFADIYSINVDSNVEDKHVSVTKADYENDIKSFISFAVGCMFGRYDLNQEGLSYAGGNFDFDSFNPDIVDNDNIIPILDTEYFEDDIVGKFVSFVKEVWGSENLEENLNFIAGALNTRGNTSREMIRNYFLNNFYADHVKMYKKCPIYWQFDSGKQNGFKCLIYIHRYESDLLARIRTEYLHKTQKAIEQNISNSDNIINNSTIASEKNKFSKLKNKLLKQLEETREYDEALANIAHKNIDLDLDDGIKVNYDKFQNVDIPKEGQKNKKFKLLKKI